MNTPSRSAPLPCHRQCRYCQQEFVPGHLNQKFCSIKCINTHQQAYQHRYYLNQKRRPKHYVINYSNRRFFCVIPKFYQQQLRRSPHEVRITYQTGAAQLDFFIGKVGEFEFNLYGRLFRVNLPIPFCTEHDFLTTYQHWEVLYELGATPMTLVIGHVRVLHDPEWIRNQPALITKEEMAIKRPKR